MTPDEYDIMLLAQGGACAACGDPFTKTPHIDHCHETGVVRGLLCTQCNLALGLLRDDPVRIAALLAFINQHRK